MKPISLIGLSVCAAILVGCETTDVTGAGNQEAKRLAALQRQREKTQLDEAHANLWNAQENTLNRDSNPLRAY
jgi:hypothetical protein